ncbi:MULTISPECIES: efflux RND transporter periplasmic adaptor subunit [unclassified Rhizobium]|uniref:efflux RND transporter periplasmic adaptor subunit n=1 Tax=unclassified Rhizobium TaxID=2613769 RepID=UPI001780F279|nr:MULTISPECIES: efflux RND transporter periplasmic adaptor subunit [unclassified Rhizobium]MBD8688294.1 efflux RND transporter periplasmic adaptor subunit [Rhizobium sp. CFBP 13644]MBD8692749.1 efflux RND transporter periplasmic adaptor subunit [Rhizobium sp. CFBP 13717]
MKTSLTAATLLAAATFLTSCEQHEETVEKPRPVLSVVVQPAPAATLTLPGTVTARIETQFGFRILGRIVARNVQVGDIVKKGDVLAAIDPLSLELAVRSSQSDLSNAQAQLANAVTNEQRQQTLFERQSAAKATFESAQQERETAVANVNKAQANLDKANEQLGYSRLLAEFDGVVTKTSAEVGQVVSAGQSVITVAQPKERDAVIDVPETAGALLKSGAAFDVALQLDASYHAKGVVREIAPEADDATRTFRTKLTLINPPDALRLGAVVTATATADAQSIIRVPPSAIKVDGSKTSVWIVDEKAAKVSSRDITVDPASVPGGPVIVSSGINPGDRVVVAGVNQLKDGQAVRIEQENAQ